MNNDIEPINHHWRNNPMRLTKARHQSPLKALLFLQQSDNRRLKENAWKYNAQRLQEQKEASTATKIWALHKKQMIVLGTGNIDQEMNYKSSPSRLVPKIQTSNHLLTPTLHHCCIFPSAITGTPSQNEALQLCSPLTPPGHLAQQESQDRNHGHSSFHADI